MIMLKRGGEPGYTLTELLVTVAILGLVAAAVAGVYQVSQQSYTRASSLEAAQLGARAGLDRMAEELRLIGSFWVGASGAGNAIIAAAPTSITFMANVDDSSVVNGAEATASSAVIATSTSVPLSLTATATADAFKVYAPPNDALNDYIYIANGGWRKVKRITGLSGSTLTIASAFGPPTFPVGSLVRDVKRITYARNAVNNTLTRSQGGSDADTIVDGVSGLTFTYFDTAGGALSANPDPGLIREIRVDLTVQGADGSARRMTTRVRPRSLP